jgi:hypothetical protein
LIASGAFPSNTGTAAAVVPAAVCALLAMIGVFAAVIRVCLNPDGPTDALTQCASLKVAPVEIGSHVYARCSAEAGPAATA